MPTRLRQLRITRSDLVDKGAAYDPETGEGAHVLLYKRADAVDDEELGLSKMTVETADDDEEVYDDADMPVAMPDDIVAAQAARDAYYRAHDAFMQSFSTIMDCVPAADQPKYLQEAVKQFGAQLSTITKSSRPFGTDAVVQDALTAVEVELAAVQKAGRKISSQRLEQLHTALGVLQGIIREQEGDDMAEAQQHATDEAELAALMTRAETAEAELAKLTTQIEDLTKRLEAATTQVSALEVEKAETDAKLVETLTPEARRERLYKNASPELRAELEELRKSADTERELRKAETERRERTEYQSQVVQKMAALPVTADDWWETYRFIEKAEEPHRSKLLELINRSNEALRQSPLFKELGYTGGSGESSNTAYDRITARAKAMVEKGDVPSLAEGITKVADTDPALYAEYRAERRAR